MRRSAKQFAIGTAIAAGLGYLAGILTAPKSGKETRHDIKNAAQRAKTDAEHKLKYLHSELTELIDEAKKRAGKSTTKTKAGLKDAIEKAQNAKQKVREVLSAIHEGDAVDEDLKKAINQAKKASHHLKQYIKKDAKTTKAYENVNSHC
jgi:gas vesicle protein